MIWSVRSKKKMPILKPFIYAATKMAKPVLAEIKALLDVYALKVFPQAPWIPQCSIRLTIGMLLIFTYYMAALKSTIIEASAPSNPSLLALFHGNDVEAQCQGGGLITAYAVFLKSQAHCFDIDLSTPSPPKGIIILLRFLAWERGQIEVF